MSIISMVISSLARPFYIIGLHGVSGKLWHLMEKIDHLKKTWPTYLHGLPTYLAHLVRLQGGRT